MYMLCSFFFFFNDTATTEIYTLSLHDALPIYMRQADAWGLGGRVTWTGLVEDPFAAGVYDAADVVCQVSRWEEVFGSVIARSEEHTSELQSHLNLVCRLLLEKKKNI